MTEQTCRLNSSLSDASFKLSCDSVLSKLIRPDQSTIDLILHHDNPDKAEIILAKDLKSLNKQFGNQSSTPIIDKNLHKYKRQYFGYIDKNGNRILLI